jgi:hypothetical protein
MTLCGTCSHVVKDGEGNPVSCHALVKYMPRDTCMFYKLHRKYGSIKAEGIVEHWLETINDKEYEELYALISDSRNRLEEIQEYIGE